MRPNCSTVFDAITAGATASSHVIYATDVVRIWGQMVVAGTALGTIAVQASNDLPVGKSPQTFIPTNWSTIGSTISISGAGVFQTPVIECSFSYIKLLYTDTFVSVGTVTTVADSAGSLNNTYFLLDAPNGGTKYYVWFNVNSAGTDPMIAGRTGIEVDLATNATANTVASAINTAFAANPSFTSGVATNHVTLTAVAGGPGAALVDGAVATGFVFALTAATGTITARIEAKSL